MPMLAFYATPGRLGRLDCLPALLFQQHGKQSALRKGQR
jgi:hypothetical protein